LKHATHIINRLPTPFLNNKALYKVLHGHLPDFTMLRVFGCLAYVSILTVARTKLDHRASKCIFLGFKTGVKGFFLYDIIRKSCFISHNVLFYETQFPYANTTSSLPHSDIINPVTTKTSFDELMQYDTPLSTNIIPTTQPIDSNNCLQPDHINDLEIRVSTRVKKPPSYLADYYCHHASSNSTSIVSFPLHFVLSYSKCSNTDNDFYLSIYGTLDPTTYKEASQLAYWRTQL